jgi:two-component system nitrate/nitrite response regulator NarL
MGKPSCTVRIFRVGRQAIFLAGLRNLLAQEPDFEVAGAAANWQEANKLTAELKPDILLIDLWDLSFASGDVSLVAETSRRRQPSPDRTGNSLEALGSAGQREDAGVTKPNKSSAGVRTIVLAVAGEEPQIAEAFRQGARGAVLKDSGVAALIQCIRGVMSDKYWFGEREVASLEAALCRLRETVDLPPPRKTFQLTRRELEVVAATVSGFTNREIAVRLSISEHTVKHHLTNIFDKVGVYNRLELMLFAFHHGLVGKSE